MKRRARKKRKNGLLGDIARGIGLAAKKTGKGYAKMARATHQAKFDAADSNSKRRDRRTSDHFGPASRYAAKKRSITAEIKREYTDAEIRQMIKDRDPRISARPHRANPKSKRKAAARKRNNSGDLLDAAKMYEKFHGKPADKVTTRHEREIARKDYAKLGDLVKLEVDGEHCLVFEEGSGTIVACDPKGKQIYFIGGTQNVDGSLNTLGVDRTKDLIDLGDCTQIEYFTRKKFDQFKPVVYYHEFGEETGVRPRLMYNRLNKKLYLVGGEYQVKEEGIVN